MKIKDFLKGFVVFIIILAITFFVLILFLNPIIQDSYQKGYLRGLNESCNLINNEYTNDWEDYGCPSGNCVPIINLPNLSFD